MEDHSNRMRDAMLSLRDIAEMVGDAAAQIAVMNRMSIPNTKRRDTKPKPARNRDKIKAARKQRNKK